METPAFERSAGEGRFPLRVFTVGTPSPIRASVWPMSEPSWPGSAPPSPSSPVPSRSRPYRYHCIPASVWRRLSSSSGWASPCRCSHGLCGESPSAPSAEVHLYRYRCWLCRLLLASPPWPFSYYSESCFDETAAPVVRSRASAGANRSGLATHRSRARHRALVSLRLLPSVLGPWSIIIGIAALTVDATVWALAARRAQHMRRAVHRSATPTRCRTAAHRRRRHHNRRPPSA
jgi:hypothetical protein